MSNKIYRTVTFEIEPSGNCSQCLSEVKIINRLSACLAFGDILNDYKQCRACKDYLEVEKAKVNNKLIFENVSSNIVCSRITGERQLLDLTLKITPGNKVQCNTAYGKTGKLKVTVEWEK